MEQAIKSNDPVLIKKEASKAKELIKELAVIQANAQGKHAKCKENLAHLSKYHWGFWGLLILFGGMVIWKIRLWLPI